MNRAEEATNRFAQGFSCSQAVFATYARELGLDEDVALRIASGFGGGMGGTGHTCGAVTGALMVLGLKHGPDTPDRDAKQAIYARIQRFLAEFRCRQGAVECRDLLGVDISTPEGVQRARDAGLFQQKCPPLVAAACQILDELSGQSRSSGQ